ncbi:MAG: MBOAT family protein [Clostridiales bacterium]|nr:MBOAT family protein [Clostridiales bacterium]
MSFTSLEFLCFLPVVTALYWLCPQRQRWAVLLAASYGFYMSWAPWTGLLLAGATLLSWLAGRRIAAATSLGLRRLWLALGCGGPLACLALFKYADFALETVGSDLVLGLVLPIGISFYTFQTLSYVVDVYRGDLAPEGHLGYYALFVSFFPQLVAGPIERPGHLLPQLRADHRPRWADFCQGLVLLARGYFKKLVIADYFALLADPVFAAVEEANGPGTAAAAALFAVQIYCDFSGYSDIASGAARLLGIELMENFRRPYLAQTVRDFWRKWHISLTQWFTDYLYKPLGGSRRGKARQICNVLIVFLVSGLWHGAAWHYVVWGGIHGCYLAAGLLLGGRLSRFPLPGRLTVWVRRLWVFLLVCLAWIFFRAETVGDALTLLLALPTGWNLQGLAAAQTLMGAGRLDLLAIPLLLCCLTLLEGTPLPTGRGSLRGETRWALTLYYLLTAILLGWLMLLAGDGETAFLYFQF